VFRFALSTPGKAALPEDAACHHPGGRRLRTDHKILSRPHILVPVSLWTYTPWSRLSCVPLL